MCGICGVVQLDGRPRPVVAPEVLDRMTDAMVHRGPDDRGIYLADGIALGARRLSIIDVEGGHQPFANEDGLIWAVQNGELYNHGQLRAELRDDGHGFRSRCDTEVLPHLYERHGPAFPERLRGKFAIAVWDGRERRLVLARDRLGVKPLYYARCGDLLVFASELKSVLASGLVQGDLDYQAIDAYLTFGFVPGPRTPLAGVSKLLPGERLVVEDGRVRADRYWTYPRPAADGRALSEDEYAAGLMDELEEAVRLRLMSDVPLGAMLSGGLDSSLVVALMARNTSEPVKTFSVGFAEDEAHSELADARYVADVFGTDHHELELSYTERAVDLAELVWYLDEPLADLSALGFLALSELASRHVTVALSGQGADELLGGYTKHQAAAVAGRLAWLPGGIRKAAPSVLGRAPAGVRRAARTLAASGPADRLLAMSGQLDASLRGELLRGPLAQVDGLEARRSVLALLDGVPDDPLPATLHVDGQLALVDDMLHYFDRASMAHSLEVRVPFLDHRVVEFSARIPPGLKVRGLTRKYLLKRAAEGLVPDRIVHKRKLGFFMGAQAGWLRAQMPGAVAAYLRAPEARYPELLDRGTVERLLAAHAAGNGRGQVRLLLAILMLEVWLSSYLPRALRAPVPIRPQVRVPARASRLG